MNKREFVLSAIKGINPKWKRGKDFSRLNLTGADLTGAKLTEADLTGADLTGADLTWAKLTGAKLTEAKLTEANLTWADLRKANLDFSCLPLWCGSLKMIVDTRIRKQIAYHLLSIIGDDKDEFLKDPYAFANGFHRVREVGKL